MTHSALALLGFAAWTLTLLIGIVAHRATLTLTGKRAPNSFSPAGTDVSPLGGRIVRAHANCVENLPVALGVLGLAIVTDHTEVTEGLALPFVAARVAQSCAHVVSTSNPMVMVRFTFFAAQLAILVWWVVGLGRALL